MVELTALVATRATRSLCSATKLVNAGHSIEMWPTQSVLRRSGGGCILLQRCGMRDILSIRVRKSCEINAITFSTMKREVQSLKSDLRALRTGHLSTPSQTPGHLKRNFDTSLTTPSRVKSRHPRRVYSESCAFDHVSATFKVSDGYVTELLAKDPAANASVELYRAKVSVWETWNIFSQSCERDAPRCK